MPRIDAQWLLADLLGRPRTWLLAHGDARLTPQAAADWPALLHRHRDGEPLAYLLGWAEFHGLRLQVGPAVLVPRPDTETLVDWALEQLSRSRPETAVSRVLDLGTGSGAIALAVKQGCPTAAVVGTDASPQALALAAENGRRLGLQVSWRQGTWWRAVAADEAYDLVLSNPPYIAEADAHLTGLRHEPRSALCAGTDGLDDLNHLIAHARPHLAPGGWLMLEHGWDQAVAVQARLREAGFIRVETRKDLAGRARCSGGCLPAALA